MEQLLSADKDIDQFVFDYINDSLKYAIAIVGPWGSGKTRYIEQHLRIELRNKGYQLLRVSMFGVDGTEELYSRLFAALFDSKKDAGGDSPNKKRARIKLNVKAFVKEAGFGIAAQHGVSLAATPRMLFDIKCDKTCVVVLDDIERGSEAFKSQDFFGVINDLVENRGLKVVVVTNDLKTIGDEFRDKLVWKHIHYKPDPGERALNLCGDIDNDIAGEKACSLISKAATTTQCRNARSIIKAKPLVEMFSVSNVLADSKRAESGRKDAFVEAVGYAFMKAMGNAPEPPQKTSDVQLADEKWLEHANKEIEYEHYRVIGIIDRYFDAGEFVSQEDVDASLAKFMDSRYPDSEGAARMIASMDKLNHITDFDEEEAERCVKEFSDAVGAADYNPCDIKRVVSRAADMRSIEIAGAPSVEMMLESGKRLIDSDVNKAYKDFHVDYANWDGDFFDKDIDTLDQLDSYCVEKYREACIEMAKSLADASPQELIEWLDQVVPANGAMPDFDVLLSMDPSVIVELFKKGNPQDQFFVNRIIRRLAPCAHLLNAEGEIADSWLVSIESGLSGLSLGPVARCRRKWVIDNIDDIRRRFKEDEDHQV